MVKESACQCRRSRFDPWVGKIHGNPLQYSWVKNSMNSGARWAVVRGVAKNRTRLSDQAQPSSHSLHSLIPFCLPCSFATEPLYNRALNRKCILLDNLWLINFHLPIVVSALSSCIFIIFMGFSRQEYWSGLPFPSPVDHVLSGPEGTCLQSFHVAGSRITVDGDCSHEIKRRLLLGRKAMTNLTY